MYSNFDFVRRVVPETSTSFIVPVSAVPTPNLLLHFDGTDGSTVFTDSSPAAHTITPAGSAQLDTAQFVFGTASGLFASASADYITGDGGADLNFSSAVNFTVDFRVRFSDLTGEEIMYEHRTSANPIGSIRKSGGNVLILKANTFSTDITGTTALVADIWYHVAWTRASGISRLFLNGSQEGSDFADVANYSFDANTPQVARATLNGWMEELRVVTGTAVWTSNFTPPSSPYDPP